MSAAIKRASPQLGRVLMGVCVAALMGVYLGLQTRFSKPPAAEEVGVGGAPPQFSFVIKLLTYNRLHSLIRCLHSLSAADYGSHGVKLHVFIDHFQLGDATPSAINSSLKEAHAIVNYVDNFTWIHGPKAIHYRTCNAGLQGQWLEAWWPTSDHEFAFMVEDDMRLSPLYFKYLVQVIQTYYYDPSNYDPTIYGISLQRPRLVPGKHGNPLQVDNATNLFLYQLVGTWGQLLFPRPWKEFRFWYDTHRSMNFKPILDGMVTTGWYHRSKERIWTPWIIKFAYSKGYFNLYTHFLNEQALSVSYRDKGVNTKKEAGPDSNLIDEQSLLGIKFWEMKPLKHLKRYDYCFHEVKPGRLIKKVQDLYKVVPYFQANRTVILVDGLGFPEEVVRNWLCQFSKFRMRNYVMLLDNHVLEEDFLSRGHAVMHLVIQIDDLYIKRKLTAVDAITWILQAGYSVWVTKVDTLWAANPLPLIREFNADMLGFAHGMGVATDFLFIKGSEDTLSLWRSIYEHVLHQAEVLPQSEAKEGFLEAAIGSLVSKSTLSFKFLSQALKTDIMSAYRNRSNDLQVPVALVTGFQTTDTYVRALKSLGLWMLDMELACTGVYC